MGRRSVHTPEELREHIIKAATELITTEGLAGLSAREIARRIGYSPGTIYNVFVNLDDLVLTIEERMLDDLDAALKDLPSSQDPRTHLTQLAEAYLRFTHQNPRLWNLLFEHHMPAGREVPVWYQAKLDLLLAQVEEALVPRFVHLGESRLKRAARVLWAGVHGITSLSTADKLANVSAESAGPMIEDLIMNYLTGLQQE